jgi:hypothetical protein
MRSTILRAVERADHDPVWDRPWEGLPRRAHAPCSRAGGDASEDPDPGERWKRQRSDKEQSR